MSDDMNDVDPCECMFSHEMAMRRLLSFLRQSQSACTDTDCIDALPGITNPGSSSDNSFSMMLMMWVVVATVLFLMRPRTLRQRPGADGLNKNDNNPSLPPPPPPPSAL